MSKNKCHIGKNTDKRCSNLKVKNTPMKNESTWKYLGDHVNNTGTVKATIDERKSKAFGLSAEIISIANSGEMEDEVRNHFKTSHDGQRDTL